MLPYNTPPKGGFGVVMRGASGLSCGGLPGCHAGGFRPNTSPQVTSEFPTFLSSPD
jgi:hypothetical protein